MSLFALTTVFVAAAVAEATIDCGCHLVRCETSRGILTECQNPARRGCCHGIGYWLDETSDQRQSCCMDATGAPFLVPGDCPLVVTTAVAPPPPFPCVQVSVVGDATYCLITGPVCSAMPGSVCPRRGDVAIADCTSTLPSYDVRTKTCVAKRDASCKALPSGGVGCVWNPV
ncbi:Aste57867_2187 [Aphanomyces stellatus]|uniref:Aste57867_2187 protein n=1 Tax=Aphanomyces stellatus TaxID=120398 RepID=A0A485K8F8_9STRA|nr:hypothetical protein As57867_002182 [Aphanomyces stellatus]VFT79390.1 Aste57867_2187 [Aphanomyces stellatus]